MDAEKQQQLEMFLGLKPQQYLPSTRLPYRDDPGLPLDYPETDDDEDPVGALGFPLGQGSDKRAGGSTALAEFAGRLGAGGERLLPFGKSASQGSLAGGGELQHAQHLQHLGAMKHGGASDGDLLLLDDEMGSGRAAQRGAAAGDEAGRASGLQAVRPLSDPLGLL
jgi:hypothetical protein